MVANPASVPFRDQNGTPISYWYAPAFQSGNETFRRPSRVFVISNLAAGRLRRNACLSKGMSIWLILLAVQVVVTIYAFARKSGATNRFEEDRLAYRS